MAFLSSRTLGSTTTSVPADFSSDRMVDQNPTDGISSLKFGPAADVLSVGSWDNKVRLYEVGADKNSPAIKRAEYDHQDAVLDVGWFLDGSKAVSGGCDNAVRAFDMGSGQAIQIGQHDQPVRCVQGVEVPGTQVVASASWDRTLKYWDARQQQPIATIQLPERAYAMATQKSLLIVACGNRKLVIVNLQNPQTIYKTMDSPLKLQTRSLACHGNGEGFAIGSIEGRCAIQYVDDAKQSSDGFAFKCCREHRTTPGKPGDNVYAVQSISVHPIHNTLCTSGSEGILKFWDKDSRTRLRISKPFPAPVLCTDFNHNGSLLAYGVSYDWSKGHSFNGPNQPIQVRIHNLEDIEVRPKNKRK